MEREEGEEGEGWCLRWKQKRRRSVGGVGKLILRRNNHENNERKKQFMINCLLLPLPYLHHPSQTLFTNTALPAFPHTSPFSSSFSSTRYTLFSSATSPRFIDGRCLQNGGEEKNEEKKDQKRMKKEEEEKKRKRKKEERKLKKISKRKKMGKSEEDYFGGML
jgi:hypothetical protein